MAGPFKMKGSPMQRNFGIGSPMRDDTKRRDNRSWYAKAIDEAKQVKAYVKTALTTPRLSQGGGKGGISPHEAGKKAYKKKEKQHQSRTRNVYPKTSQPQLSEIIKRN